jgi:pyruvate/2-oxoglutarate/acetoin dehydrogenase E1 component
MSITYLEAIREAQTKLLREDERVFIYGQDIAGKFGGAFKATKGLGPRPKHADQRRRDDRDCNRRGARRNATDRRNAVR